MAKRKKRATKRAKRPVPNAPLTIPSKLTKDKTVQLALLGVVAVLAIVGLVLLFGVAQETATGKLIGSYAPQCSTHADCGGAHYCGQIGPVVRCMERQPLGASCYENANCRSNACSRAGFCVNP